MRRRATAPATVWRKLEAQINVARWHADRLDEEVLIAAKLQLPEFDPIEEEPTEAAGMVRALWRMPLGPVGSVVAWLEAAGVLVIGKELGRTSRVDGLSQWVGDRPIVIFNTDAPIDRQRLTLAHELGHLVLHGRSVVVEEVEQQATDFAAEFLMPAAEIRPSLRKVSLGSLLDLKRYWGTSMAALIQRGVMLGTITRQEQTRLYKTLSARGMRKNEPGSEDLRPEVPQLARHIADTLSRRGLSDHEIAVMAGFASAESNSIFRPTTDKPTLLRLV